MNLVKYLKVTFSHEQQKYGINTVSVSFKPHLSVSARQNAGIWTIQYNIRRPNMHRSGGETPQLLLFDADPCGFFGRRRRVSGHRNPPLPLLLHLLASLPGVDGETSAVGTEFGQSDVTDQ